LYTPTMTQSTARREALLVVVKYFIYSQFALLIVLVIDPGLSRTK
jgi:hypothetical protein